MARRLLVPLAAAALVLGLACCGDGEPEPRKTDLIDLSGDGASDGGGEPSDGGGEEPVNAAPDIPAPDPADFPGMDENTEDGAIVAFRYYIAVSVWSHLTGDTELMSGLESDPCRACDEFNKDIPELQERGDYWGETSVSDVMFWRDDSNDFDHRVTYQYTLSPHSRPAAEVGERMELPTLEYAVAGGMIWSEGQWLVDDLAAEWGEDVF